LFSGSEQLRASIRQLCVGQLHPLSLKSAASVRVVR